MPLSRVRVYDFQLHTPTYMHARTHARMHARTHSYACKHRSINTHRYILTCTHTHTHIHARACAYSFTCTFACTLTCKHSQTYLATMNTSPCLYNQCQPFEERSLHSVTPTVNRKSVIPSHSSVDASLHSS